MTNQKEGERDPSSANLGDAGKEKFFKILEEKHDAKYKWRKMVDMNKKDNEFIGTLYMRPCEETPIDMIWIDIKVGDCTPQEYMKLFEEGPPMKVATERKKVRDIDENSSLIYLKIKLPMVDPREQLLRRTVIDNGDGTWIHLLQSVLDDEFPITDGVVRA